MTRTPALLLLVFSITACAPFPLSREEPAEGDSAGAVTRDDRDTGAAPSPSAVLLQQARSHLAEAAASLERAIRIEPNNPWLYLELARVHFASGNLQQAEAQARRAASLAGGDDTARRAAERLLADIG